ncbi:phage antirepressor N-terminal domain-containing protein [Nitrosophilus kaiyonis]|uniref:phage antirepressor N-terminal domain-containing protein n=1 Tax=Nitrosophilus kaiyonis TaxID=2930200 RepID=UPI002492CB78|nr:phage antirepressor N-terminal domain-containing protein [Nitrosophilus kaiyonis]
MSAKLQLVKFHSDIIEVVEAEVVENDFVSIAANKSGIVNEKGYFIVVKRVCENLKLHYETQFKKLKSNPTYKTQLVEVSTKGGKQKAFCIPLSKLYAWLYTINPKRVKPEVREKLLKYQEECQDVLYNHFIQKATMHCPASDNLNTRIAGYKGQLALRKKEIERLRFELLACKEKSREDILLQHSILDLAGSLARQQEELQEWAFHLEYVAKRVKDIAKSTEHHLKAFEKYKNAKSNAKAQKQRAKKEMQWERYLLKQKSKKDKSTN